MQLRSSFAERKDSGLAFTYKIDESINILCFEDIKLT